MNKGRSIAKCIMQTSFILFIMPALMPAYAESPTIGSFSDSIYQSQYSVFALIAVILLLVALSIYVSKKDAYIRREREQLEQANEKLTQMNRTKNDFIARISHDIRTPIGIISSMTEFAKEDMDDKDKLKQDLDRISSSNNFLRSLINDVLDISRIDSGSIEIHPVPYTFEQHSANIRNILEPMCADKGLHYKMGRMHATKGVIVADQERINQITLNLLSNAVKYTPRGGTVEYISDSEDLPDAKMRFGFYVRDNGIGMSQEFLTKMFDPFTVEMDNPQREANVTGTGLGLSIVKRMVDMMHGSIEVKSELGKGTEIHCSFIFPDATRDPAYSGMLKEVENKQITSDSMHGNILLVEDNAINREIAKRILTGFGLTIEEAADGKEGLDRFTQSAQGTYQLILMDIQMPVKDGYEATREIRDSLHPDAKKIPIIALTANAF